MNARRACGVIARVAVVVVALGGSASAQTQASARIRGRAVDPAGHPIENVQVTLAPGARRAVGFDNGDFDFTGLAVGTYTLTARRIGYQVGTISVFARDSITRVTIMLVPIPRELDSIRIRERQSGLRYTAVVLDQNDRPVTDAEVVAVGARRNITTDSLGRFSVAGLARGTLILQIRKIGYARYFNSLRILSERADTVYMARLPQTMTPVQVKEIGGYGMDYWAHRDMQQRQVWKSAMGGAISREELAGQGKEDLCDALPGTPTGVRLGIHNDPYCKSIPRGLRTILIDGVHCVTELLSDFDADEVEMVEFIPGGGKHGQAADMSGSLLARGCNAPPPVYVIWTREHPDLHLQVAPKDSAIITRHDTTRSVVGTVFDSVAQRPLAGAHVHLADLNRDTVTDSLGVFRFDSVSAGVHGVWVDHPALDSLGLYSLGERVDASAPGASHVTLAIPSFATLWRLACGNVPAPGGDSGFVFGHVHADDSVAASRASVEGEWHATAEERSGTGATLVRRSVHPDSTAGYAICGIPVGGVVTISVRDSAAAAIPVSFRLGASRIARRDLTLPSGGAFERLLADSADVAPPVSDDGAELVGMVRDSTGRPLRDVRVSISGVAGEWRTDSVGALVARGIPPGEHVITATAVGFVRERRLADVAAGDSASLHLALARLMTLRTITIAERKRYAAIHAELDWRRKFGFGYRADSTELARYPGLGEAFNYPGVYTQFRAGQWSIYMKGMFMIGSKSSKTLAMTCRPTIWLDGYVIDIGEANSLFKDEVGVIEVYPTAARAPLEYAGGTNCGVVLIWRKDYINP